VTLDFDRWLIIGVIAILLGGIAATAWTAQNEDGRLREELLTKSRLVEEGLSPDLVMGLTGTDTDLSSPGYLALKEELIRVRSADPQIRFLYYLGQRSDGAVVILIDSESPDSPDYSPPGQVYSEVSQDQLSSFIADREETTIGPYTDRWGTWISSVTPVTDPRTGEVIAVFGMDIDAQGWYIELVKTSLPMAIATFILLFVLLVFAYAHQRNEQEKKILERSERTERESRHQLNDIINFLPDATFVIDPSGKVITWNKAIEKMTGVGAADILGKGNYEYSMPFYGERRPILIDLIGDPGNEIVSRYTGGIQRQGDLLSTEVSLHRPDGSDRILAVRASPLRDVSGNLTGAIESILDITDRKQAEQKLNQSEERLRLLLQNINDGILVHSIPAAGPMRILEVNDRACQMLGYAQDELLQLSVQDLCLPERRDGLRDSLGDFFLKGHTIYETDIQRKDGERVPVEISARIFEMKGEPTSLLVLRDISVRKMLEKEMEFHTTELLQYSNALHQVNRKLNLMNTITRHDISNQLTTLLGYLDLMKEQYPDPKLQQYLGIGIHTTQNIQNQIMFSREYQDIGSQAPRWFDLKTVVGSAAAGLPLAPILLTLDCDRVGIYADPLLERVFYTLLENSIRHGSTATRIRISCRQQGDGLLILFEDDGEGVPMEHKEDIFQHKYFKHTGYGLFLSVSILAITGITIRETGVPGIGARFEILVPGGAYRFGGESAKH
jgi:PAS domain S-box-containing protein